MASKNNFILIKGFLLCITAILFIIPALAFAADQEMPIPSPTGNCALCHDWADHPTDNCLACHDNAKPEPEATMQGGHGGLNVTTANQLVATGPVGNCVACHIYVTPDNWACDKCHPSKYSGWFPPSEPNPNSMFPASYTHDGSRLDNYLGQDRTYNCQDCHDQPLWNVPKHDSTFGAVYKHVSSTTGCESCHNSILTTEHYKWTGDNGLPLDCYTCHDSSRPEVNIAGLTGNSGCNACHNRLHNMNAVAKTPEDVLLYPGLKWSVPVSGSLLQGDPGVEADTTGYRTILSNRANLSSDTVWAFYRDGLAACGWSLQSAPPDAGSTQFKVIFTKGADKTTIWFYSSEYPDGTGSVATGSRIQIIFKG